MKFMKFLIGLDVWIICFILFVYLFDLNQNISNEWYYIAGGVGRFGADLAEEIFKKYFMRL